MNKLHLIVPLGKEASRGDQIENAQYFVDKGYAEQLQEDQLTLETFNETIQCWIARQIDDIVVLQELCLMLCHKFIKDTRTSRSSDKEKGRQVFSEILCFFF